MPEGLGGSLIENYAIYFAAISAIITASIVIYTKAVKPMIKAVSSYYSTILKIDRIFEELTPNGGTSIKDKIDRIDTKLSMVQQVQQAMALETKAILFITDPVGNYTWINRTFTRTVGRGISEILGRGWQNCIALDERDHIVIEWYKSVEEKREFSMDFNFETPDGKKIPCRCRSYKLVDSKGETIGYWGNCTIL